MLVAWETSHTGVLLPVLLNLFVQERSDGQHFSHNISHSISLSFQSVFSDVWVRRRILSAWREHLSVLYAQV